jgi:hypothetical protein
MKTVTPQKPAQQTGPLPNPATLGQFVFRDGVWYLKTAHKAHG